MDTFFSVGILLSHCTENFRRRELSWFRKDSSIRNFYGKKGVYHGLPSKIFGLTLLKKIVGGAFNVSKKFRYRKIICIRRRYQYFPLNSFCLTMPKSFVGQSFCASDFFGYRKLLWMKGGCLAVFRWNFFVSQCQKLSWGNPSMFQNNSDVEKVYA